MQVGLIVSPGPVSLQQVREVFLASCKAHNIDERAWLEDVLRRMLTVDAAPEGRKKELRKSMRSSFG